MKAGSWLLGGLGVAVVAALAYVAFRPETVPVDLAEVRRAPMQITVNADGRTRIRDVYEVAAPIAGQAQRSPVEVGDRVTRDETVVAVVRPTEPALLDVRSREQARAAVNEAEAALRVARSDLHTAAEELEYARGEHERTKKLVERGVASLTALEDAERMLSLRLAALESAQSSVEMAESRLERERARLIGPSPEEEDGSCCVELHAPVDGVVLEVANISARSVQAGQMLLSVGRPDDLEIVADLLSSDAVRIEEGARAIVERWGGPDPLEARVRRIEPAARTKVSALGIEEQRVDVLFDLVTPADEREALGHGFAVYVRIVEWEADDVLQVPLSAAFREEGQWRVFVAEDGAARKVPVSLGRRNGEAAQVLDGLEPGQTVITHPSDRVADGTPVAPRETL